MIMNTRCLLACAAIAIAASAGASEIYKWTDEDGNVHYEDRPTGAPSEQRLDISYERTNNEAVQQRVQARVDAQTTREEARSVAAAQEQERAEQLAEEEARSKKCDSYRARLETYVQSRRLYRTDDNGERVYLDDDQTQEARQRVEELIAENCT
jgi:hypothetical protein